MRAADMLVLMSVRSASRLKSSITLNVRKRCPEHNASDMQSADRVSLGLNGTASGIFTRAGRRRLPLRLNLGRSERRAGTSGTCRSLLLELATSGTACPSRDASSRSIESSRFRICADVTTRLARQFGPVYGGGQHQHDVPEVRKRMPLSSRSSSTPTCLSPLLRVISPPLDDIVLNCARNESRTVPGRNPYLSVR
jgi:hypothetical protein